MTYRSLLVSIAVAVFCAFAVVVLAGADRKPKSTSILPGQYRMDRPDKSTMVILDTATNISYIYLKHKTGEWRLDETVNLTGAGAETMTTVIAKPE